jgi:RHS repeat-associated protein
MGNKYLREVDIPNTSSGLNFERSYNSTNAAPNTTMGAGWQHNWDLRLNVVPIDGTGNLFSGTASAHRSDGRVLIFTKASSSNTWLPDPDVTDQLVELTTGGTVSGYQVIDGATDRVETYDLSGAVTSIDDRRTANTFTLAYDTFGRLTSVTDRSGRSIQIDYDDASRIAAVWGPDVIYGSPTGPSVIYAYSGAGRLDSATWSGGTARQYWYEDSTYPYALTGITDENGIRYASYGYDTAGRATSESLWSGPGQTAPVAQYTLAFQPNNLTHVLDPLGQQRDYQFKIVQGVAVLDNVSAPCPLCGGPGATKSRTYDPVTGFTDLVTDFNDNVIDYDYDSRGLEVKRVDASNDPSPPVTSAKRTIESIWNAGFRVPNQRTTKNASGTVESLTEWTYNSRGQTTARCEIDPADTSGYVCSATTAPSIVAKVRRWAYAYCEQADVTAGACPQIGLLTSVNGPRLPGDMGMGSGDDTTINTYYQTDDATCSSGGACPHRHGDLWKVTNALGQVTTEFVTYDKNGRVTRNKDANGTYTDFLYHSRGWLTDRIVRASATGTPGAGDATTHIDYDAVGNVTKVTSPDGDYLVYAYDDAHRLVKITDKLGNSIDYCPGGAGSATCLDAAGNRWVEQIEDPSSTIKRSLSRVYNQLSQLTKVFNATPQATELSDTFDSPVNGVALTDGYDGNGNRGMVQDGLGSKTNQSFDPLNRLKNAIQNYQGTDPDPNANDINTGYVYDTRDNLRQVTDPDGLYTVYTYDGLNNLTNLSSPDTGNSTYGYDKAGNRTSFTDNRGTLTTYSYDALNRLRTSSYPTGSLNVSYAYDQSNTTTGCTTSYPTGRLTTMTDGSGSTTYCYDRRGNVLTKKQVTNGVTFTTTYTYSVGDRLASIVYPSAMQVTYTRDNAGRINFASYKIGATITTLVSAATYYPFGPLNALTFGNGRIETKKYDKNYAIDQITSSVTGGLTLDFTPDVMGDIVNVSSTIAPATPDRVYTYDPLYRLRKAQTGAAAPLEAYTYDKTGDRLSVALNGGTATTYTYTAGTHRLASVGGTTRTTDANGNTKTGVATGFSFNYDDKNRFATAVMGLTTYTYQTNGRGERVKKATSGGSATNTEYVYNESGQLLGDYDNTGAALNEYVYLDSQPIAVVTGGTLYYIETDRLGSPRQVINRTTNAVVWSWSLLGNAFGATAATPAGVTFNLRFPGQYADTETGLNYNYFRDYEPGTGRYAESDPIGLRGGINTYGYARSSPLNYFDPSGLQSMCRLALTTTGALIGGFAGYGCGCIVGGILAGGAGTLVAPGVGTVGGAAAGCGGGGSWGGAAGAAAGATAGNAAANAMCSKSPYLECADHCHQAYELQLSSVCAFIKTDTERQACIRNALSLYQDCLQDCQGNNPS